MGTDAGNAADSNMVQQFATIANGYIRTNHAKRTNLYSTADLRRGIDTR
jgi:hypothetical protein